MRGADEREGKRWKGKRGKEKGEEMEGGEEKLREEFIGEKREKRKEGDGKVVMLELLTV